MIYWFVLAAFIFIIIYLYIQNSVLSTNTYNISIPKTHSKLNGKKILFFSDTHFRNRNSDRIHDRMLEEIGLQSPDLILFGGDIIHASASELAIEHAKDFFFRVGKIAPTYVVLGNHDMRHERANDIYTQLSIAGVHILKNEAKWLSFDDKRIGFWLMGLGAYETTLEDTTNALAQINLPKDSKNEPKILLAHFPHYFNEYLQNDETRPDLILSGHAHGGQVILPLIGGLFAPGQGFNPTYDFGLFKSEKYPSSRLILTRGVGNSTFPFRINNRPELVVIELNG